MPALFGGRQVCVGFISGLVYTRTQSAAIGILFDWSGAFTSAGGVSRRLYCLCNGIITSGSITLSLFVSDIRILSNMAWTIGHHTQMFSCLGTG